MKLDLVFTGVGGQGIIVASDVYCESALLEGFDVAKSETHGMAQRGGSIMVHVRIGDDVSSPLIEQGTSEILVGFEILESVRALPLLMDKGKVILNTKYIPPSPVLQGLVKSPNITELIGIIREKAIDVYEVDAISLATKAGSLLTMNTVLLGALLSIPENPVREDSLREAICSRFEPKHHDVNIKALQLGRKSLQ